MWKWFMERIRKRSAATIANIAIVLIKQTDYLLFRLIEQRKRAFLEKGGIKEEMSRTEGITGREGSREFIRVIRGYGDDKAQSS